MIKQIIRLVSPGAFVSCFVDEEWPVKDVLVRPTYLSICAADQRYFCGHRPESILRTKLPMALFHEAVGEVLYDPTGKFLVGNKVALVPCIPPKNSIKTADNYYEGGGFHSSNCDGFAQELLGLPHVQLIQVPQEEKIFVFTELVSVCIHAVSRWRLKVEEVGDNVIGLWGDGPLAFVLALVLKRLEPNSKLVIFGKHDAKLAFFSFADEVINIASKRKHCIDHGFECVGGSGAGEAIQDMLDRITPQGTLCLLGVSEVSPAVYTRLILEKGLTLLGCSRSSFTDFTQAVDIIRDPWIQGNLAKIISCDVGISSTKDLEVAFKNDLGLPYKTVLRWLI